jgi:hypothetical protein
MTSPSSAGYRPPGDGDWHASPDTLAAYARGQAGQAGEADGAPAWSVEAHLAKCPRCRSALSAHVAPERLAGNRSVLLVRAALGGEGRVYRALGRCGFPDHVLRLLAATPSLRLSWLLSVIGVLAVLVGEAAAARYGWIPAVGHGQVHAAGPGRIGGYPGQGLAPFLLVAPLLVLAGVAAAFLPVFNPAGRLEVAAPCSGFTLLLVRTVCALGTALVLVVAAAFVVPGPGWLPVALLLPSLALCAFALAAATVVDPRAAAVVAGILWAGPAAWLAADHVPLLIAAPYAQLGCAAVLCAGVAVLLVRRDRFEWGWMR